MIAGPQTQWTKIVLGTHYVLSSWRFCTLQRRSPKACGTVLDCFGWFVAASAALSSDALQVVGDCNMITGICRRL